jgi:hypothetical protein
MNDFQGNLAADEAKKFDPTKVDAVQPEKKSEPESNTNTNEA